MKDRKTDAIPVTSSGQLPCAEDINTSNQSDCSRTFRSDTLSIPPEAQMELNQLNPPQADWTMESNSTLLQHLKSPMDVHRAAACTALANGVQGISLSSPLAQRLLPLLRIDTVPVRVVLAAAGALRNLTNDLNETIPELNSCGRAIAFIVCELSKVLNTREVEDDAAFALLLTQYIWTLCNLVYVNHLMFDF